MTQISELVKESAESLVRAELQRDTHAVHVPRSMSSSDYNGLQSSTESCGIIPISA